MKHDIILLELFSGIGGFTEGFKRAGFTIKKHYASEVDKHAIANYKYNYPDAEQLGTVTNVSEWRIEKPTVITFGSPCQDFSLAGKGLGLDGNKSSLIKYAIMAIERFRPDVFIWENVKGAFSTNDGADYWAIIQAFANLPGYRLEQQLVNTSWVLPQNRERIYIVGHSAGRSEPRVFPFGDADKGFNEGIGGGMEIQTAHCLNARMAKCGRDDNYVQISANTKQGFEIAEQGDSINFSVPSSKTRRGRVGKGVAQTLDTQCNQAVLANKIHHKDWTGSSNGASQPKVEVKCVAQRGRPDENEKRNVQKFEPRNDGNTNTLTGVQKDNMILEDSNIRRLTEIECERLQGFADNHTKFGVYEKQVWINKKEGTFRIVEGVQEIPKTQRYKLCGNAVTVDIVEMIAKKLIA